MAYIENNLIGEEKIIAKGNIPMVIFFNSAIIFLIGLFLSMQHIAWLILVLISGFFLIDTAIWAATREIAITSKRIIYKWGLIQTHTTEVNLENIVSVNVKQGVIGKLFNYGSLKVKGTGNTSLSTSDIKNPLAFRKNILSYIEEMKA